MQDRQQEFQIENQSKDITNLREELKANKNMLMQLQNEFKEFVVRSREAEKLSKVEIEKLNFERESIISERDVAIARAKDAEGTLMAHRQASTTTTEPARSHNIPVSSPLSLAKRPTQQAMLHLASELAYSSASTTPEIYSNELREPISNSAQQHSRSFIHNSLLGLSVRSPTLSSSETVLSLHTQGASSAIATDADAPRFDVLPGPSTPSQNIRSKAACLPPIQDNRQMDVDKFPVATNSAKGKEREGKPVPPINAMSESRATSSIPKPLDFLSYSRRAKKRIPLPSQSASMGKGLPLWTDNPTYEGQDSQPLDTAVLAEQLSSLAESLKAAYLDHPNVLAQRSHRASSRFFRQQTIRRPKPQGRTERLKWVRDEMQSMLEINKDMEILHKAEDIYRTGSSIQLCMDSYELGHGTGPVVLKPMQINWDKIDGKWNGKLLEMFFQHCEEEKFLGGNLSEEDLLKVRELFLNRLRRLATIINKYRPTQTMTLEAFGKRVKNRHMAELARQRRTTRRNELKAVRTDTALANIPDLDIPIEELTEEEKMWLDTYRILREYGEAGISSDETDEDERGAYIVRKLDWINRKYAKRVAAKLDKARCTTNQYGNPHGHQPRKRKRNSRHVSPSVRKPPTQLPLNLYDKQWYSNLPATHKVLLQPKEPMVMHAVWGPDSDEEDDE